MIPKSGEVGAARKAETRVTGFMEGRLEKRRVLRSILLWVLLVPSLLLGKGPPLALCLEVPPLDHYVNDYAGILTPSQRSTLEEMLRQHEARTTNQVVILLLPSLEGESLEEFSIRVAHGRIGQKGRDNGVLLLVAMKERKIRIEVGYGLEGALTDAESSLIIRQIMAPAFRAGDYFGGLYAGVRAVLQAIEGEFQAVRPSHAPPHRGTRGSLSGLFLILLIPLGLLGVLPAPLRMGGGGLLGFLGGLLLFHSLLAAVMGAIFGLGFLFFLSLGGALRGPFRGGFWGGGFGGGMGGGGFAGGGGGFGGGGASGSW